MAYRRWPGDNRGGGSGWDASEWAFHNAIEELREQRRRASAVNRRGFRRVIWPIVLVFILMLARVASGVEFPEWALTYHLGVVFVSVLSSTCLFPGLYLEGRLKDVKMDEFFRPDPAVGLSATIQRLTEEAEALREPNERVIRQIRIWNNVAIACGALSILLMVVGVALLIALW